MKVKCAIFDFDGTLFDSMFIWESAGEVYLQSLGKKSKDSMREDIKTMSLYQSAVYLKKEYELSLSVEEIIYGINQTIEHFYINDVLPKEGVIEFLDKMKSLNISMCIASASDRYQIDAALKRCHMTYYFDEIFTCSEVGHGKDEPIIFQKAMEYFNVSRNQTIVFEDALHVIKTAKTDQFIVAGVYDSSEIKQNEIKNIADYYIHDYRNVDYFFRLLEEGE